MFSDEASGLSVPVRLSPPRREPKGWCLALKPGLAAFHRAWDHRGTRPTTKLGGVQVSSETGFSLSCSTMCRVVLVILLFFLVALPLYPAQESVSTTRKDDDNSEESFVAPIFANDPHVAALSRGQPVEGDLILGQQQLIGFSVPKRGGLGFPDVLLSLEIASVGGDADVFCLPLILTPANHFVVPGKANAVWRSAHTVGSDYVFISRNHSEFLRGVTAVNTTDGVTEYARLVCSVVGLAQLPTEYKVELDVDYESRALVQEELESMRRIREECCSELRSCGGWQHVERTITGSNVTDTSLPLDMCHVHGSLCDSEGHLVRLSMVAFDLRCEFPAKEIASFTRLEKLALSSNRLTGNIGEIAKELQVSVCPTWF